MVNNLEYYKVFYFAAKSRNLTIAAEELHISQPAVSQSLKQLENAIGTPLFVRASRGIRLTAEGQVLFEHIEKGYQQIELGEKKLAQMLNLECGELRIGASDMTLRFYLLPYLEAFHEKNPHIKVSVSNAPTPETLNLLRQGNIDFGVVSTPFECHKQIHSVPVKPLVDGFVAGRKFMQYKHKMLDLHELEKLPIITLEKNTSTRSYMDGFLKERGVVMKPEFELATSDMIVQFALRNLGIGNVMMEFAEEYISTGELFPLQFQDIIPKRHACIVTKIGNPLSRAAEGLLHIMNEK